MDLRLAEVSSLLKISHKKIIEWIKEGKLRSYKFQQEYYFSRDEIEQLLLRQQIDLDASEIDEIGSLKFDLFRAILKGMVYQSPPASDKFALIEASTQHIAEHLRLDATTLASLLLERERVMSTALGGGIALPHTRDFLMPADNDIVCIVYPDEPMAFDAPDGEPVHCCFFLFSHCDKNHLHLLAKIASFCQRKEHRDLLKSKPHQKELLIAIRDWEKNA